MVGKKWRRIRIRWRRNRGSPCKESCNPRGFRRCERIIMVKQEESKRLCRSVEQKVVECPSSQNGHSLLHFLTNLSFDPLKLFSISITSNFTTLSFLITKFYINLVHKYFNAMKLQYEVLFANKLAYKQSLSQLQYCYIHVFLNWNLKYGFEASRIPNSFFFILSLNKQIKTINVLVTFTRGLYFFIKRPIFCQILSIFLSI